LAGYEQVASADPGWYAMLAEGCRRAAECVAEQVAVLHRARGELAVAWGACTDRDAADQELRALLVRLETAGQALATLADALAGQEAALRRSRHTVADALAQARAVGFTVDPDGRVRARVTPVPVGVRTLVERLTAHIEDALRYADDVDAATADVAEHLRASLPAG
jgi:hypothetical protein